MKRSRNRQQTEKRIVDAAIGLLAEEGFAGFGVNAVSARAGVDKVLLYRYFSGLDGLLEHIGRTETLFPAAAAMLDSDITGFCRNYHRAIADNALAASLHNWERVVENPLTHAFRKQREAFWNEAVLLVRPQNESARSLLALLAAIPAGAFSPERLRPLMALTEFAPADPPAQPGPDAAERLADNLL